MGWNLRFTGLLAIAAAMSLLALAGAARAGSCWPDIDVCVPGGGATGRPVALMSSLFAESGAGVSDAPAAPSLERFYIPGAHGPSEPAQGPDGAVWFTLNRAIGRVAADGRVTVFRTPHLDPNDFGKPASVDGAVWFVDSTHSLVGRIDLAGHVTVASRNFPAGPESLLGTQLSDIAAGGDGNLWITDWGANAIWRMTPSGQATKIVRLHRGLAWEPGQIITGADGSLWFEIPGGIGRVTVAGTWRVWRFHAGKYVGVSIAAIPDGGVLAATSSGALFRVSPAGTVTRLPGNHARPSWMMLTSGPDGAVWFTFSGGIGRMTADGAVQAIWRDRFGASEDLQGFLVDGLAFDAAGNAWVANNGADSLERLAPPGSEPGPIRPLQRRAGLFRDPGAIAAGPDGAMWVTQSGHGVVRVDRAGIQTAYHGLAGRAVTVAPLPDGGAWLADGRRGLVQLRPDGRTRRYTRGLRRRAWISDVALGPHGSVWFIDAGHSDRIGRITPGGHLREFTRGLGKHRWLLTIGRGPDNRMWVTDQDGAIDAVSQSGRIHRYTRGLTRQDTPVAIIAGPDGNLWFTEFGTSAVGRITPAGRIRVWSVRSRPASIAAGSDGALWFNTVSGLGRITVHGHRSMFSVRSGRPIPFEGMAAAPDGRLWFIEYNGPTAIGAVDPRRLAELADLPGGMPSARPLAGATATGRLPVATGWHSVHAWR